LLEEYRTRLEAAEDAHSLYDIAKDLIAKLGELDKAVTELVKRWRDEALEKNATCNAMRGPDKTVPYDQDREERLSTEACLLNQHSEELSEAWVLVVKAHD
jgi:hypothetical protein